ncbi:transmembrane protein 177 [Pogonomyrmex barbatus]|uniref:Transmembrane protein 177 n=1 Tax=Pogonomyrmex barbatus TaxID=144034 RepID=A0A6I9VZ97_9HYME|nr:transmembrane protein 177 [Pogonomyrmex barbatus]XP_011633819.1 transmembrane protein 177 [Pogonomyrmex barbatus]XP_011633820.1 transmembrane protein 177 [Pogonomyrmex barbatus]
MNIFSFKSVIFGVTTTAIGYYTILLPHTILLKRYRYVVATYRMGKEEPLGFKVQEKIQRVMDDLKLPEDIRNTIKPFSVFGFDLFHAGTLNAKYGAILGIPVNFTKTNEHIRENLQIREEYMDWTRPDAHNFLNASMLSENAQKFAIAREILRILAEEPYFDSFGLALTIATLWTLYNIVSYRFRLRERSAITRFTFYTVFVMSGALWWFGVKDYRSNRLDKENDEDLCNLGPEYIKGGQEFYEKLLIRNKALRSLLGTAGKRIFTAYGNEESFLRQKHIPITNRKDFFDSRLRSLEEAK